MAVPATFKAAVVPAPGAQQIVAERSLPALKSGEVAIKITATAINPVDWKMRDFKFWLKEYPAVLGSDAAGEIADVGPDVEGFAVGDRVLFQGIISDYDGSTFQQYCRMPAVLVGHTPKNISDEAAAGVSLATVCGVTAFYDSTGAGLPPPWEKGSDKAGAGKALVIIGGSSSVGQYAIQLAKMSGFERIIVNSSLKHADYLKALGAHVVLDRATKSSPQDFVDAVGNLTLAFVLDTISIASTQKLGVEILQLAGVKDSQVIVVNGAQKEAVALGQEGETKVAVTQVIGAGSWPNLRHLSEPLMRHLGGEDGWIGTGRYVPNRPVVVPGGLAAIETAMSRNKNGVSGEKVVIRPQE